MKLLVYIPGWVNYSLGWEQIVGLKAQQEKLNQSGIAFELDFVVSINSIASIPSEYEDKFRSVDPNFRLFPSNVADVNINLGFLDALKSDADLFWIVSPGDPISESALVRIHEYFSQPWKLDFVVADEDGRGVRDIVLQINRLNFKVLSEASFGMVTGVIYRLAVFKPYLHLGVQASFTGWGQLAVLLGGARRTDGIVGRILPSDYFYSRGDAKSLSEDEKLENLRSYAHSFFGFVILISMLSQRPVPQVRRWVYRNWFRIGSYFDAYVQEKYGYIRLTDLRHLAKISIAETDFFTRTFYSFVSKVNLGRIKRKLTRGI